MAINEREGLFSPCSEWIWLCGAPECNCYGQFQISFRPAQAQGRVKLHISVEGQYAAFVNGQYIPSAQYADFPDYKAVQTPDITPFLHRGENLLEIRVWYPGRDSSVCRREPPGLRFEIRQGNVLLCGSGGKAPSGLYTGRGGKHHSAAGNDLPLPHAGACAVGKGGCCPKGGPIG